MTTHDPQLHEDARRTLAGIEADIQHAQATLAHLQGPGAEHFNGPMRRAVDGLEDQDLDAWTAQAEGQRQAQR